MLADVEYSDFDNFENTYIFNDNGSIAVIIISIKNWVEYIVK